MRRAVFLLGLLALLSAPAFAEGPEEYFKKAMKILKSWRRSRMALKFWELMKRPHFRTLGSSYLQGKAAWKRSR